MASRPRTQDLPVSIADIRAAEARIEGQVVRTPTLLSGPLSQLAGADLYLKLENLQFTASYKERGALNMLLLMDEATRAKGVITASAGNHAQALAYHGRRLGVAVTIVMPKPTPAVKIKQTESHGARIVLEGETFDEAYAHARELEVREGLTFVPPFDHGDIVAGQGTVALEMLADVPDLDVLVVPIGGGGLISGVGIAARAIKPDIELIGVQAELYPSMYAAFNDEDMPAKGDTIAEGIAVKQPGGLTSEIIKSIVDDIVLVAEHDVENGVSLFIQRQKIVVEGAGASGLGAVLRYNERFRGRKVGLIVTGGNIDTRLIANILLRDLARSGRLARLRIQLQDRPGALLSVVRLFDKHQINIIEVLHQRLFTALPARGVFIDVECEARDREHLAGLINDLETHGFSVQPVRIH